MDEIMKQFGAYTHARPDGRVFYVGKGTEKRAHTLFQGRNPHHANIVRKYGAENIIVGWVACENEDQAFGLECYLIATCKEMGIKLCNKTNGGEGVSGYVATDELRTRRSLNAKGNQHRLGTKQSEETKARIKDAFRNMSLENRIALSKVRSINGTGKIHSAETRAKISAANKGSQNFLGREHSAETKAKMRAAQKGRVFSEEHRARLSASSRWHKKEV